MSFFNWIIEIKCWAKICWLFCFLCFVNWETKFAFSYIPSWNHVWVRVSASRVRADTFMWPLLLFDYTFTLSRLLHVDNWKSKLPVSCLHRLLYPTFFIVGPNNTMHVQICLSLVWTAWSRNMFWRGVSWLFLDARNFSKCLLFFLNSWQNNQRYYWWSWMYST